MQREYMFEFSGSKEDFLNVLNRFSNNISYSGDSFYYFDDFIVKKIDDTIHFGVERSGHSGGYWFIPTITEYDDRIEFCGKVRYIGPNAERRKGLKAIDGIGEFLLFLLLLPFALAIRIYKFFEWMIRKIFNRPKLKAKTTEERLFDLMDNHLGCVRK